MRSVRRTPLAALAIAALTTTAFAAEPPTKRDSQPVATTQARLLAALQQTAEALRSRSVEPAELAQFRELLAAAEAFWQDEAVPLDRRGKYCGLAKARLVDAAAILRRQEATKAQAARRPATIRPQPATLAQVAPLGTTAALPNVVADEAQALIDLITAVVRPDTWDVNGGQGVIRYWSLGHALVIYNTGDVHERIGGTVGYLRK